MALSEAGLGDDRCEKPTARSTDGVASGDGGGARPLVVDVARASSRLRDAKGRREEGGMAELGIGEVARRAGIAPSAIRYYEAEGLIAKAPRRNGRRVYGMDVLQRLALIELARDAGFRIAETKRLLAGFDRRTPPGERWRRLAETKLAELDARIAEAERMREVLHAVMRCECPSFDDCARLCRPGEGG
jgi:MerR family redox-sensitive transcriptional activator SoxR